MFLVSAYPSAKSRTSKPPLHSAVAAEEWCQAMSSSTSKLWQIVPEKLSHISALINLWGHRLVTITTATTTSFFVEHVYLQYKYTCQNLLTCSIKWIPSLLLALIDLVIF